jgi:hypothetical protein
MRRSKFKINDKIDNADGATITIEQDGEHAIVRVRPAFRRREYIVPLSKVAQDIVYSVVKAELNVKV